MKRRTKAAPERAQVVASGRGAGPNDPPRGAGDRPVLCPEDGGGPRCPPGELGHWLTAQAADRPAALARVGVARPGWRGPGAEVRGRLRWAWQVMARLLDSPRQQSCEPLQPARNGAFQPAVCPPMGRGLIPPGTSPSHPLSTVLRGQASVALRTRRHPPDVTPAIQLQLLSALGAEI